MSKRRKKGFKKSYAFLVLLLITLSASLAAFLWISKIEQEIEFGNKLIIDEILYDINSHDIDVRLVNGLSTQIPVASTGPQRERTVVTMYPFGEPTAMPDCTWVGIADLSCEGRCEGVIEPKTSVKLTFRGDRSKCLIDLAKFGEQYHLELFFGKERVEQNFKVLI